MNTSTEPLSPSDISRIKRSAMVISTLLLFMTLICLLAVYFSIVSIIETKNGSGLLQYVGSDNVFSLVISVAGVTLLLFMMIYRRKLAKQDIQGGLKEIIEGRVDEKIIQTRKKGNKYRLNVEGVDIYLGKKPDTFNTVQEGDIIQVKRSPRTKILFSIDKITTKSTY